MLHLASIHEKNLTMFHRNHFILSISDLEESDIFNDHDNHISIETCRRLFPNASMSTLASLIISSIQIKIGEGVENFLLVFNEDNKVESLDFLNGLIYVFDLTPSSREQEAFYDFLRSYAQDWTHKLIAEEKRLNKSESTIH
ncbi:hypothetical protein [Bacillus velezensis]|uniref:hypothetical protein n=1 Tax=Bacillus velezensis TaxID=492670 RepID=UPI001A933B98|nr:hypothetical protein [Bacillus velezensis]BCT30374.1 hypothetical protein BVAD3_40480 [Bacillus velezensis]